MLTKIIATSNNKITVATLESIKPKFKSYAGVASEAVDLAKTGGLADAVPPLVKEMHKLGVDSRFFMPLYKQIPRSNAEKIFDIKVRLGGELVPGIVLIGKIPHTDIPAYFIGNDHFFNRDGGLYVDKNKQEYKDSNLRFTFFNRGVYETMIALRWTPDILHAHDWQAALCPALKDQMTIGNPQFKGMKTALSIHNIAFSGKFSRETISIAGFKESDYTPERFEFYDSFSFLKAGVVTSDVVFTVSPHYAKQILNQKNGCGFDGILNVHKEKLFGIVNGKEDSWDPWNDNYLKEKYDSQSVTRGKEENKKHLLKRFNLKYDPAKPVFGFVGRLTWQKGIDIIVESIERLLKEKDAQFILLGTGDERYHYELEMLRNRYPDNLGIALCYDEALSHLIIAGVDFILYPSRDEPCGLVQIFAEGDGTPPVVSEEGGLKDTVKDFDPETGTGTGVVINEVTPDALLEAMGRCMKYFDNKELLLTLRKNGMAEDFSWGKSAIEYVKVFNSLMP
ncbi:MAG TPA: hypothetical protein DF296_12675 [Candidatus Margulisbacteria bacterium]|nr:MAG: hypothetical protein A2X43_01340 [Candidatus Margulisbacteria bacterium GWD2_39_127]OGI06158.1 MAG: hypothetical protein A2X41_10585 [Candidatus Margulisbacteria bacterium GWE2_39_32]HAR63258.1 hypothetical protein [Candidatus Margulisiibacteriota bacterium]HCT86037.1 hypothetical protein [Candidatus Margulisiibacteriota bacterium]